MSPENEQNGWTVYQKLVLSELGKHDNRLDELKKEISELRIQQTKNSSELTVIARSVLESAQKIEQALKQIDTHKLDIALLKMKIYGMASALSAAVAISIQAFFKFFSGGNS